MSKARVSSLAVTSTPPVSTSKVRVSSLSVNAPAPVASKARVSSIRVDYAGSQSRVRVSSIEVRARGAASTTRWIKRGGVLVSLGADVTTPTFPTWGPYGELGAYKPDANTAGCRDESLLVLKTGDQVISTGGTSATNRRVIENWDVDGIIDVRAPWVHIRNCRIRGGAARTSATGLVRFENAAATNGLIEDCTLRSDNPDYAKDGIRGHSYTARRCDISWVVDAFGVGISVPATDVHIEANYVHDFPYRSSPLQSDGHTHNDGIQMYGGSNVYIIGNNFQGFIDPAASNLTSPYASSGGQITGQNILTQNTTSVDIDNVNVLDNWFDGGGEAGVIHALEINGRQYTNLAVKRNKVGRNQRPIGGVKYTVRVAAVISPTDIPLTGPDANVYEDDGSPITVTRF